MPAEALVLEDEFKQEVRGMSYHFEKRPNNRWTLFRETSEKKIEPIVNFSEIPSEPVDFVTPNYYNSTYPDSMFVKNRIANARFEDGHASIGDGNFRLVRGGEETTIPVESKEHEFALLKEHFGIVLA
jgi:arylamine N-acetyltransferase